MNEVAAGQFLYITLYISRIIRFDVLKVLRLDNTTSFLLREINFPEAHRFAFFEKKKKTKEMKTETLILIFIDSMRIRQRT